jgi:hypothetical protein
MIRIERERVSEAGSSGGFSAILGTRRPAATTSRARARPSQRREGVRIGSARVKRACAVPWLVMVCDRWGVGS